MSLENFKDDTAKWENEVETLLGPVQTFIYPFGGYQDQYNTINDKVKDLYNAGFRIFCGVGGNVFNATIYDGKAIFMDRANFDGYALRNRATSYARFFDTNAVYDHDARVVPYSKKD
jgi:hypothetical protein